MKGLSIAIMALVTLSATTSALASDAPAPVPKHHHVILDTVGGATLGAVIGCAASLGTAAVLTHEIGGDSRAIFYSTALWLGCPALGTTGGVIGGWVAHHMASTANEKALAAQPAAKSAPSSSGVTQAQ